MKTKIVLTKKGVKKVRKRCEKSIKKKNCVNEKGVKKGVKKECKKKKCMNKKGVKKGVEKTVWEV